MEAKLTALHDASPDNRGSETSPGNGSLSSCRNASADSTSWASCDTLVLMRVPKKSSKTRAFGVNQKPGSGSAQAAIAAQLSVLAWKISKWTRDIRTETVPSKYWLVFKLLRLYFVQSETLPPT